jgi:hypothetical protein
MTKHKVGKFYRIWGDGDSLYRLEAIEGEFGFFNSTGWKSMKNAISVGDDELSNIVKNLENNIKYLKGEK